MTIKGNRSEKRNIGDVDTAVEFINHRPNEDFIVYDASQEIVDQIRRRVRNIIKKG